MTRLMKVGVVCIGLVVTMGVQAQGDIRAELRKGYDPSLVAKEGQVPDLIAFVGDGNENWELRLIASYALQTEPLRSVVQAGHRSLFEAAEESLRLKLAGVFNPAEYPARDVLFRLQGLWLAGAKELTQEDWSRGSFAVWLDHVLLNYDVSLLDEAMSDEARARPDLVESVKAAIEEAMAEKFPGLGYYRGLPHRNLRTVRIECTVSNASVGADQLEKEQCSHFHRKTVQAKITDRAAELMKKIEEVNKKEMELDKRMDGVAPGYRETKSKPYDWNKMYQTEQGKRDYLRNQSAYEKANFDAQTYIQEYGNRYAYEQMLKELSNLRWQRGMLSMRLDEEMSAQPTSVVEKIAYTRTKQSRTCQCEGRADIRVTSKEGAMTLSSLLSKDRSDTLSWRSTWTFSKTTWPALPEVGLEGSDGELRSVDTCRRQTIDGCFHDVAEFFVKSAGKEVFPWVARTNRSDNATEASRQEYHARALLTFFDPGALLAKWRVDGAEGLDRFLSGRRSLYLMQIATPDEQLRTAAITGDTAMVRQLLDLDFRVDGTDGSKLTALHHAALHGHAEIARMLIAHGADLAAKDGTGRNPLHDAVLRGHANVAALLMAKGSGIDAKDEDGDTPLANAVEYGHADVADLLVQGGADLRFKDPIDRTLLHLAAMSDNPAVIEFLLAKGLDINAMDRYSRTPLYIAADYGKAAVAMLLIDKGCDIHSREGEHEWTALYPAARNGLESVVKALVAKGANVNSKDKYGGVPLHYALEKGTVSLVEFLIAGGTDVNVKGNKGWTPLHKAASCGNQAVVEYLIAKGADIAQKTEQGQTPADVAFENKHDAVGQWLAARATGDARTAAWGAALVSAVENGDEKEAKALIAKGAPIHHSDSRGRTPLHWAAIKNSTSFAEFLIAGGAKLDAQDLSGITPLFFAVEDGHDSMIQLLIAKGADVNLADHDGETPLHRAAIKGKASLAELLLAKNAQFTPDQKGQSPLHLAAKFGHVDLVKLLLNKGAAVTAKSKEGHTPLHLAAAYRCVEVAGLLVAGGANVNEKKNDGVCPLHVAAKQNCMPIVDLLLEKGADVKARDEDGSNAIHWALYASFQQADMVERLLDKGANPNDKGYQGYTPLHLAIDAGKQDIVKLLLSKGADMYAAYNDDGWTAMHKALECNNTEAVRILKDNGYDLTRQDAKGKTVLFTAEQLKRTKAIEILKEKFF